MKNISFKITSLFISFSLLAIQTNASNLVLSLHQQADIEIILNFDENEIYSEFESTNSLASFLMENDNSYSQQIIDTYSNLISVAESTYSDKTDQYTENVTSTNSPLPFLIGCAFGLMGVGFAGILIVALMYDNNNREIRKSLFGCVVGTIVPFALYTVFILMETSYNTY